MTIREQVEREIAMFVACRNSGDDDCMGAACIGCPCYDDGTDDQREYSA